MIISFVSIIQKETVAIEDRTLKIFALKEKKQRLHDTITIKNDRVLIDIQRFSIYFYDRPN